MDNPTEHFDQVKSESTVDSNHRDFAAKPSFSIMESNNHHDSHFEQSFYPDNWTSSTAHQTAPLNWYSNHRELLVSQNTVSCDLQLPTLQLSSLPACHGGLLPCGTSAYSSPWRSSPSDHSPISPNSFLNPQATLMSYNENDHPTSGDISPMYPDIDRDAYERISQWSRPNTRFESLAATTPEDGVVQSTEAYTPATSFEDEDQEMLSMPPAAGCGFKNDSTAELTRRRTKRSAGEMGHVTTASTPEFMAALQHEFRVRESLDVVSSSVDTTTSAAASTSSSPGQSEEPNLMSKDEYLLAMRHQGFSYKEIKRRGKFSEAESTLRGRVRNLVKAKKDRVRKPIWTKHDIKLLRIAVRRHFQSGAYGRSSSNQKLPWKKVADWLHGHGSTYQFGSATCARKWEQVKDVEAK